MVHQFPVWAVEKTDTALGREQTKVVIFSANRIKKSVFCNIKFTVKLNYTFGENSKANLNFVRDN